MRIILKLIALPVMLALSLLNAALAFLHSIAGWLCWTLSGILLVLCAFSFIVEGDNASGLRELIAAFLLSPCVVPALAGWIVDGIGELRYALSDFIFG